MVRSLTTVGGAVGAAGVGQCEDGWSEDSCCWRVGVFDLCSDTPR